MAKKCDQAMVIFDCQPKLDGGKNDHNGQKNDHHGQNDQVMVIFLAGKVGSDSSTKIGDFVVLPIF